MTNTVKAPGAGKGGERTLTRLADGFGALAEPKRLRILASLAGGERCACELTGCCGERQPLLSFHLRKLREAGLVRARREGRWMHYSIDREALRALGDAALAIAAADPPEGGCC